MYGKLKKKKKLIIREKDSWSDGAEYCTFGAVVMVSGALIR